MEITLQQNDIVLAVKQYMANNGIRADISQIDFSMARKSGNALTATVTMNGSLLGNPAPISNTDTTVVTGTTVAESKPEPVAAETPAIAKVEPAPTVVAETKVAAVVEAVADPVPAPAPFEVDSEEDEPVGLAFATPTTAPVAAAPVRPTSLFG